MDECGDCVLSLTASVMLFIHVTLNTLILLILLIHPKSPRPCPQSCSSTAVKMSVKKNAVTLVGSWASSAVLVFILGVSARV